MSKELKQQIKDGGSAVKGMYKTVSHEASSLTHQVAGTTSGALKLAARGTKGALHKVERATKATGHVIFAPLGLVKKKKPINSKRRSSIAARLSLMDLAQIVEDETEFPPVDPDETLPHMEIILRKKITGITVKQFYDLIWKDGAVDKDGGEPFYTSWLAASGKDEIQFQSWEQAEGGSSSPFAYPGLWDKDATRYGQRRTVDFTFTRTTHLYTGPPVAKVKQRHFGKVSGDERCILHMQIEMDGIPFADCFNVQIRWVVTRIGGTAEKPTLEIKVGLFVNFVKQTILAAKIRSGTTEETTKTQKSLLLAVLAKCTDFIVAHGGDDSALVYVVEEEEDEVLPGETLNEQPFDCFGGSLQRLMFELFPKQPRPNDIVALKARSVKSRLQDIIDAWDDQPLATVDPTVEAKIESELTDVLEALGNIEKYIVEQKLE
jgi:VAD1 Analog of StAR-related lipid transfer domain